MRRRRPLHLSLLVLGVVAALAAAGWFVWLPSYRPSRRAGERYGLDVSHFQGTIDWPLVATEGIGFVYVKATEGSHSVDERFAENWSAAGEAGIQRGAYHFFSLCSPGASQAANFLATLPPDPGSLPPAVDLELANNCDARPPKASVDAQVADFLTAVDAAWGRPTVIYLGADFRSTYGVDELAGHPLWLPHFISRPSDPWQVWQVDGFAHVDGVPGDVDLDVMR